MDSKRSIKTDIIITSIVACGVVTGVAACLFLVKKPKVLLEMSKLEVNKTKSSILHTCRLVNSKIRRYNKTLTAYNFNTNNRLCRYRPRYLNKQKL